MAKKAKKKVAIKKVETPLTPLEAKRVAIAKDALAQVKAEKYEVIAGNGYIVNYDLDDQISNLYYSLDEHGQNPEKVELREYLDKMLGNVNKCEVCAKGALFLSAIRKFNNYSIEDAVMCLDAAASNETQKIFGLRNADLIESYFEHSDPYKEFQIGEEWFSYRWSDGYPDDQERLILILKNVIANKGTFTPSKLKWKSAKQMLTIDEEGL